MNKQILALLSGVVIFSASSAFAMDADTPYGKSKVSPKPIWIYANEGLTLEQLEALPSRDYKVSTAIYTYRVVDTEAFDRHLKHLKSPVAPNVDGILYDFMTCKKTTMNEGPDGSYEAVTYTYTTKPENQKIAPCYFIVKTKDAPIFLMNHTMAITFKKQ